MTENQELKKMTVVINGRSYPVKVTLEEAALLPQIEKDLNDNIQQLQMSYKDIDMQDCLSMVLLTTALSKSKKDESADILKKVNALNTQIEKVL